ncbi:MAG: response regulator [Thermodesulfobacteria bacterium]|nr:response regulator [Thermodesulfobacteriota bacterium]
MGMEDDILKDFLAESKENLELLDQQFVELEQDPENEELIKSIFRTIHTIKGTAGFFGFTTLEGIAHFAEDILSKLRDGIIKVNEDITTMLLQSVDYIKAILAELEATGKEPVDTEYLDFIVDLRNFSEKVAKGIAEADSGGQEEQAKEEAPAQEEAKAEGEQDKAEEAKEEKKAEEKPEEKAEKKAEEKEKPKEAPKPQAKKKAPARKPAPATAHLTESHVRIDVHLLDQLMTLAGELVLSRNRLTQLANQINDPELLTANQRMSLVVTELQEQIMKTRMQPIGNVFNKFPRIVRDLAKAAEKKVQLRIEGAETELDRSIIESIKDPLTHMVRNSIDHGIEPPDIRVQKEKPPVGTLTMKAYHEGGQVIIEIVDDGAGIDPDKLRKKAVEKGIITEEQAEALSDREALMLIFQPGFSTAEKVTNISGRGVGMDVVKTNIEKLGGTVELLSEVNVGTTIKIKIPLTLAIIPALIVTSMGQRYAIPQVNLVELVHLNPKLMERDVQKIGNSEFYRLRGEILPLIRLRNVLRLEESEEQQHEEGMNIVVLNAGGHLFGLVVDSISDSEEIVVKPLGSHLKHIPVFAGTTLMGDGRVALILDVVGITSSAAAGDDSMKHGTVVSTKTVEDDHQFLLLCTIAPEEYFALPLALVNRLDKIKATDLEFVGGKEVIQYRGHSMPIIRLENYLPISPLPDQDEYHLIVFHMNNKDIAFLVSQIDDSLDLAIDVEEGTFKQEGILGSAIIKDRTTLFLDVYQIISMHDPDFFTQEELFAEVPAKILLAEDSTFYRNMLSSYLTGAGYDVVQAEDGQKAWEIFQTEKFDLVITDIEMPRMNGFEFTRKIRNESNNKDVPIIAVTSLAGDENRQRGLEAGIDDYQAKLDREKVLQAVTRLLKEKALENAA